MVRSGTRAAAWREHVRGTMRVRVRELRMTGVPILQAAAAAGAAWALAHYVLGHAHPFFAPIAATIVLGLVPGRRTRRSSSTRARRCRSA